MRYISHYQSPLGMMTLASDEEYLTGVWFDGQKYDRQGMNLTEVCEKETDVLCQTKKWLDIYFTGKKPDYLPKIRVEGSDFRKLIAEIMCEIPFGVIKTYGDIAREAAVRLGKERMSAQAVGGAVGHNAISILIPCHRVVGTGGSLTGYAGGIEKKVALLKNEGIDLENNHLRIPASGTAI